MLLQPFLSISFAALFTFFAAPVSEFRHKKPHTMEVNRAFLVRYTKLVTVASIKRIFSALALGITFFCTT